MPSSSSGRWSRPGIRLARLGRFARAISSPLRPTTRSGRSTELARHASSATPTTPAGASIRARVRHALTSTFAAGRFDDLHAIVRARALADGRPVDEVHVYFHLEATARAERRPLLDGGVRVYFLGPGAELVEVVD